MITHFKHFLMEKTVWPKVYIWEKGMDIPETKVTSGLHPGNIVKYLLDAINLGLIDKIIKTYHEGGHKTLQIILNDGSTHTYRLIHTNSGHVLPAGWRSEIGLKDIQKKHIKTIKYGYDAMTSRPGYLDLIDLYNFKDVSKEVDIKKDVVVLEKEYDNITFTYRVYNDGEVKEMSDGAIKRHNSILNKRSIESSKDFDVSFETIIKAHKRHENI